MQIPEAPEHELSIIKSAMLDRADMAYAADVLKPAHFQSQFRRQVWKAMLSIYHRGDNVDLAGLVNKLRQTGQLEKLGGAVKIAELTNEPPVISIKKYCQVVREKFARREILSLSEKIKKFIEDGSSATEAIEKTKARLTRIDEAALGEYRFCTIRELAGPCYEHLEMLATRNAKVSGIPTGFPDIDRVTGGFQSGNLIIIAARPSMGKTALACNIAQRAGVPVVFFSLEQSREELYYRAVSSISKISLTRLRDGRLSHEGWKTVNSAFQKTEQLPIIYDDTPALHYNELRRRAREAKRRHGVKLVIVDYLQLMHGDRNTPRYENITAISQTLKAIAKELGVPVVALSQLNRACEQRDNKRPRLSDLRDSGSIEQDADLVLFIYRDEVYRRDSEKKGQAEILFSKHRNGPAGISVELVFHGKYCLFQNKIQGEDHGRQNRL
ncbi:Replicative DNA helicase (DnaB) (EC [Olavius algarvensis associated proteobacterium Delta 3]|nr:Replicative DNA helicase (DnaB) (EC [Olavius algarvensis associated proteobacterium Delta 3]